jgi:hypothetical protein
MNKLFLFLLTLLQLSTWAQDNPTAEAQPIVEEGKRLYKSEMASWYGTDVFLAAYKDQSKIGGYFSYTEKDAAICIFFSKTEQPKVIGSISFDSTYNTTTAKTDFRERDFTSYENDIYIIRKAALAAINSDPMFKVYDNTNLNLIPLVNETEKKVYVLTGPTQHGRVIFGNDYLINFDNNNNLVNKKRLHVSMIPIDYAAESDEGKKVVGAMHSHLPETGDFITATDICTLMLYAKFTPWEQHNVVSKKYLNIWNCKTNQLTVIPMGTVDKINKDKEKRKKKKDD